MDLVQKLAGRSCKASKPKTSLKTSDPMQRLMTRFQNVNGNPRLLAGARRAFTCLAQKRAKEEGKLVYDLTRGMKMVLTKAGITY